MKKISTLPDITIGDARPNWPGPFRGDTDGGQRIRGAGDSDSKLRGAGSDGT